VFKYHYSGFGVVKTGPRTAKGGNLEPWQGSC